MHRPARWQLYRHFFAAGMFLMGSGTHAGSPPLTGEWGGPQVRFHLTEAGGTLDLACAAVHLDSPVRAGADGKFAAEGRYEDFAGGPAPADVPPPSTPAHFSGHIDGDTMQLSVHRHGDKTAQAFVLERGRRVKLIRCA